MLRTRARYVSFAAIELDFVVVGFQKCGTTTMRALLGACSDVMLLDCSDVFDFTSLLPTAHGAATVAVARNCDTEPGQAAHPEARNAGDSQ